jgi:hypothetical protein
MKNISKKLLNNPYVRVEFNNVVFLNLLNETIKNINADLKIKDKKYFHVLIEYPESWNKDLDLFQFIDKESLEEIKNKNCYFIFDASAEGFSPFEENWFDLFYFTCEKHIVDPEQIILVSSNLKDEENIKKYCKYNNKKPIKILSLPFFEHACQTDDSVDKLFNLSVNATKKTFKNKYFSSLSRVNRHHRSVGTFLLCQSGISNKGLISHDKININNYDFTEVYEKTKNTNKQVKRWIKSLPLIVDYKDFNINWALGRTYDHIHNQTIFQIVNETLVDNSNNTSLFYSEKTFRPISCFQPFLIYGQVGCNHYLKNLGYKTYENWFDLSFDYEEDYIRRYQKLLTVVEDTCKYLDTLSRDKKIEWKFKHQEILLHNVKTMNNQTYTFSKLENFVLELENQIVEQSK